MAIENDIVLIYREEKPLIFARIENIAPDHKPGWYHVKLLLLQIPLHAVTWILRERYIDGEEFTMNGERIRLEKVVCPLPDAGPLGEPPLSSATSTPKGKKVIAFQKPKSP